MNQDLYWNNNYGFKFDEKLITGKVNDYISKLLNKSDEKNVETKIDQIEKDYQNKLKDIEAMCENKSSVDELRVSNSLNILQKELEIIKLLTKYTLQNKNINYDFFLNCLDILLNLSETLRIRIGQKEINHDKQNELKQTIKDELIISVQSMSIFDDIALIYNQYIILYKQP